MADAGKLHVVVGDSQGREMPVEPPVDLQSLGLLPHHQAHRHPRAREVVPRQGFRQGIGLNPSAAPRP
jgi:hypothetical protein